MPNTTGFLSRTAPADGSAQDVSAAPASQAPAGIEVVRLADGSVLLTRPEPSSPQLYAVALEGGVLWGTDLPELLTELRQRGGRVAPHHGTVLGYLRGDDIASAGTTFYEGVLRLRVGDELRIATDGSTTRTRQQPPRPAAAAPLDQALGTALEGGTGEAVILGEDLASAALLAAAEDPALTVTVRAGSTRAAGSRTGSEGPSRARTAAQAAGRPTREVHPTTDRFKKDLRDFVRTQAEPVAGLGVYAHYCALRELARETEVRAVLDASGPHGAGLISSSTVRPASGRTGAAGGLRARLRGRSILPADAVLDPSFVSTTPAIGHLPSSAVANRDTAAVVAARRNAERFHLGIRFPLLDPGVGAALAAGSEQKQSHGRRGAAPDALAPFARRADPRAADTRPARMAAIDQGEWLNRLKGTLHQVFRSEQFAGRPWVDQRAVLEAFEAHVAGRTLGGEDLFWRLLNLELWMRECVEGGVRAEADMLPDQTGSGGSDDHGAHDDDVEHDDHGEHDEPEQKEPLAPNPGKQLDLTLPESEGGTTVRRYPLQTGKFHAQSDMDAEIAGYVSRFFAALEAALAAGGPEAAEHRDATVGREWNLTISEKIIAIMQGRSYFVWDVRPGRPARTLSRYVSRTPAGIGLGDPVTMQLAIQEAGLPRVLLASVAGAVGKLLGRRGVFYEVVGGNVRAIDGPTEYSVYPANVSAKLPPKDPDKVAAHLNDVVRAAVPAAWRDGFVGTVVMDANDIGRNTLGKAAPRSGAHYEATFADNPLGQGREQTPMAIVFER